jgi:hypothetical protein
VQFTAGGDVPRAAVLALKDGTHYEVRAVGAKLGNASFQGSPVQCTPHAPGPIYALGEDLSAKFEAVTDVRE